MKTRTKTLASILGLLLLAAGAAAASSSAGEWSGTVASVAGDDLALAGVADRFRLAGGVTEALTGRSVNARDLAAGSSVTLRIGGREADGRFRVDRVIVQSKNPLALQGAITKVGDDRRYVLVLGVRVEIDDRTAFSGSGNSGMVRSARELRAGMTVRVALVPTSSGQLRAGEIRVAAGGTTEPGEDRELKGTVTSIEGSTWTVDAKPFVVNDQTVFIGDPGIGDFVEVKFHLDGAGTAVAERIALEDGIPGIEIEFRGIVEAIGDTSWTISGQVVGVDASTVILGNPGVGDNVEVEARRASDGSLLARKIQFEDGADEEDELEFFGTVISVGDTSWTIGERVVLVNEATVFRGNPGVGDFVEVRAEQDAQGVLTATDIKLEDFGGGGDDDNGNGDEDNSGPGNGGDDSNDDNSGSGDDDSNDDDGGHHGNRGPGGGGNDDSSGHN